MIRAALASIVCALAFGGCAETGEESPANAAALQSEARDASVSVEVGVRDASITTAQRTTLTVTTVASESVDVTPPDLDGAMGDWTVTPDGPRDRTLLDGRVTVMRRYTLEPFLPGEYTVPALEFAWADADSGEQGTLTTDPLAISVRSVLDEAQGDELAGLKDLATPEREIDTLTIILLSAGAAALVSLLAALAIRRASRERERPMDRVPAHALARDALSALDPSSVRSETSAKRFFDGVSAVVRTYIEDRFALSAPDRTTEEFLHESASAHVFSPEDTALLGSFLSQCDLVKFARHAVDETDARGALDAARAFIDRTGDDSRVVVLDRDTRERLGAETLGEPEGGAP